jgi:hypothetical protein
MRGGSGYPNPPLVFPKTPKIRAVGIRKKTVNGLFSEPGKLNLSTGKVDRLARAGWQLRQVATKTYASWGISADNFN